MSHPEQERPGPQNEKDKRTPTLGSVARFALMPEFKRSVTPLFEVGRILSQVLAILFASQGLFDRDHPGLRGQGPLPLKNVIGTAWSRVEFTKEKLPQAAFFLAVVMSLVMTVATMVIVLMLSLSSVAHAAPASGNELGMFESPAGDKDWANNWIEHLLGDNRDIQIPNPGSGQNVTATGTGLVKVLKSVLSIYSLALMVLATVILLYHGIGLTVETAWRGKMMGRGSQMWAALRLVFGLGLLVPLASGLNSGQHIVIQIAKWGSGLGSYAWTAMSKELLNMNAGLLPPSNAAIGANVGRMMAIGICREVYDGAVRQDKGWISKDVETGMYKVTEISPYMDENPLIRGIGQYVRRWDVSPIPAKLAAVANNTYADLQGACGSVAYATEAAKGSILTTSAVQKLRDIHKAALFDGGVSCPSSDPNSVQNSYSVYTCAMDKGRELAAEVLAKRAGATVVKDCNSGSICKAEEKVTDLLALVTNYQDAIVKKSQEYLAKETLGSLIREDHVLKKVASGESNFGWMFAGLYYIAYSQVVSKIWEEASAVPKVDGSTTQLMENASKDSASAMINPDVPADSREAQIVAESVYGDHQSKAATELAPTFQATYNMLKADKRMSAQAIGEGITLDNSFGWIVRKGMELGIWNQNMDFFPITSFQQNANDAIGSFVILGMRLYKMSIAMFGSGAVASGVGAIIEGVSGWVAGLSLAAGPLGKAGSVLLSGSLFFTGKILSMAGALLMTLAFIIFGAALMLAFLLPIVPFWRFLLGIMTWLLSLLEMVVAVPLVALAHLTPYGDDIYSPSSKGAYMALVQLMFRPILMLIGMILAILLANSLIGFLNAVYWQAVGAAVVPDVEVATARLPDTLGVLQRLVYILIYCMVGYTICNSCFKLIDTIPQFAMGWINQQNFEKPFDYDLHGNVKNALIGGSGMLAPIKSLGSDTTKALSGMVTEPLADYKKQKLKDRLKSIDKWKKS
ncbi:MAG: DotA/TraY family protein [Alphaproteobacteria bacterium]|nr:MAG: DotA/TraY family protein [Alphaproteobacteria bacterium]